MNYRARLFGGDTASLKALAALLICGIFILGFSVLAAVSGVDSLTQQAEENLVRRGWAAHVSELTASVVPQIDWDDAVAKLDNTFDPNWARTNIGPI